MSAKKILRLALMALIVPLPSSLKRVLLVKMFGFEMAPTASIGFSLVCPSRLVMAHGARIRHLTFVGGVALEMGADSSIGALNWITGYPANATGDHFEHQHDRRPGVTLGRRASITSRHYLDATNAISVGEFSVVGGVRSTIQTHWYDVEAGRQDSAPIHIGEYCFLGTNCVVLPGASLPHHSVLAAGAVLIKAHSDPYCLYAGVPAVKKRQIVCSAGFFHRP